MTGARRGTGAFWALAACSAWGGLGCSGGSPGGPANEACVSDGQCAPAVCVGGMCVPLSATAATFDIEVAPSATSDAATTELPNQVTSGAPLTLRAERQQALSVSVSAQPSWTLPLPSPSSVVLTLPPKIAGRPDLVFQAGMTPKSDGTLVGLLVVPLSVAGRSGSLRVIPLSTAEQTSPPLTFTATIPDPPAVTPASTTPPPATDTGAGTGTATASATPATTWQLLVVERASPVSVRGRLLDALGRPPVNAFVARAFTADDGTFVSDAAILNADGSFALVVAPEGTDRPLVLNLVPQAANPLDPSFASNAFMSTNIAQGDLGTLMLPTYTLPVLFELLVNNGTDMPVPIPVATVQAWTRLGTDPLGSIEYARTAVTNASGTATVALIPAQAGSTRSYDFTVVPPEGSPYGMRCVTAVQVSSGLGTGSQLGTISLPPRARVSGIVRNSAGVAAEGIVVTATATSKSTGACAGVPPASSGAVTDETGRFQLLLDPGTFQLDYDPPGGSALPRLTEPAFEVTATDTDLSHDVDLPGGQVVQGTVLDSQSNPLPFATVRFYEQRCDGTASDCFGPTRTPPALRAQAQTDKSGQFRAVLAASH